MFLFETTVQTVVQPDGQFTKKGKRKVKSAVIEAVERMWGMPPGSKSECKSALNQRLSILRFYYDNFSDHVTFYHDQSKRTEN